MIYKNNSNPKIEAFKKRLKLKGDVYVIEHHIASLESHKKAFPKSTATTIAEAEAEFMRHLAEQRVKAPGEHEAE